MDKLLTFPCYEPAGHCVEFTETDLLQHVLVVGSTGCGKTTLLTSAIRQLLAHREVGLLILDAKVDGLVAQVRADARAAGREQDVAVFGPDGDAGFDLFGGLRSLADVEGMTRRLMLGIDTFHRDNAYWHQATTALIRAALTLLVCSGKPPAYQAAIHWMRQWFLSPQTPPAVTDLLAKLSDHKKSHPLVAAALDQVNLWRELDPRTRSNLQSCLLNVLQPLASAAAVRSFSPLKRSSFSPALAANGHICIVSVPALREPELAKLLFRLSKQEFFDQVHARQGSAHPLCGMVADEFALVVTEDDIEQLATVRSKRCFVIAATQGLESLHKRLGLVGGRAAINNLNNLVFMRNREAETAVLAFMSLGLHREKLPPAEQASEGNLFMPASPSRREAEVPVCPIGTLGRLDQHQAFLAFANGERTVQPVWFVPWFENSPAPAP